jgi:hypothetical protein
MCLKCKLPDNTNQLDLCIACVDTTPTNDDLKFVHAKDHPVLKLPRKLHQLQKPHFLSAATNAISWSQYYTGARTCIKCNKDVFSYWLCAVCFVTDGSAVSFCDDCDPRTLGLNKKFEKHNGCHPFVRVVIPPQDKNAAEAGIGGDLSSPSKEVNVPPADLGAGGGVEPATELSTTVVNTQLEDMEARLKVGLEQVADQGKILNERSAALESKV